MSPKYEKLKTLLQELFQLDQPENRTWSTMYRGDLFIHAGVGYGDEQWRQEEFGLRVPADLPRGAFVAMCRLVDVVTESDDRWLEGE